MFRFSIRDLLSLTLVVAMGLGWWLREGQLQSRIDRARSVANKWRHAAGALELHLELQGEKVTWEFEWSRVIINRGIPGELAGLVRATDRYEPSAEDD